MTNQGKFIDRQPIICAAGTPLKVDEPVKSLLQQYRPEDQLESLIEVKLKEEYQRSVIECAKARRPTFHYGIQECISPPIKSKLKEFYDKVYEAKYDSSKNRPLGQSRQCISKPDNINNDNTTFGRRNPPSDSLYSIVLPNKLPFQVLYETEDAHDKYILSHQHYFPAERIDRKYSSPPFVDTNTFGKPSNVVPDGKLTRRALEDLHYPEYFCINSAVENDFVDRYKSKLGKCLQPNYAQIAPKLPPNFAFGVSRPPDEYSGEELIYNRTPCEKKALTYESLKYLNRIRNCIKKRNSYDMEDMILELEMMDTESTGELPLKYFTCLMRDHRITVREDCIIILLLHFNMLREGGKVKIKDFLKLLDTRLDLPDLGRLDDVFLPDAPYLTTYRNFAYDLYKDDPACKAGAAGLPSQSVQRELPKVPVGMIRANIDSLSEETDVRGLIMQSVPTAFGLSHRDYFMPRSKDEIKSIFSNVGYDLQDQQKFEETWTEALKHWTCKDQMVSVEAFRHALKVRRE